MKKHSIAATSVLLLSSLTLSGTAAAQNATGEKETPRTQGSSTLRPMDARGEQTRSAHERDRDRNRNLAPAPDPDPDRPQHATKGPQPRTDWKKGDHAPDSYRGGQYVVTDWRARKLQPPSDGYNWVNVNGDYVLVDARSGLITDIIAGH